MPYLVVDRFPCYRSIRLPAEPTGRMSTVMGRGKGLRPFLHTPFPACASLPPLRSGQISLDEAEHLFHNRGASVAALRGLFAFPPESPSGFAEILTRP